MSGYREFWWKDPQAFAHSSFTGTEQAVDSRSPPPWGLTPAFARAEGCAGMTKNTPYLAHRHCLEERESTGVIDHGLAWRQRSA